MGVASLVNRADYIGNNATAVYAFNYKILSKSHLLVTTRDLAGVETKLTIDVDYSVPIASVNNVNGGSITLTAGNLPTGHALTIRRELPVKQETDVRNQGQFYPESLEDALDYGCMVDQQLKDGQRRSIKLPETANPADFDTELPATIAGTANAYIATNATGDGLTVLDATLSDGITLPAGNGIVAKNGTTSNLREIKGTTGEIDVVDGDGVSGDPTLSINSALMTSAMTAAIASAKAELYPVGTIYQNATVSTNPATLLGFGTWVAIGTGKVLVGVASGDDDFGTLGQTGGSKTHTLTTDEMPAHKHGGAAGNYKVWEWLGGGG